MLRVYKLTNIQLEYETIHNDVLAKDRRKPMFIPALRHFLTIILCEKRQPLQKHTDSRLDIKVSPQHQSLKAILAFQRTLHSGTRGTEKYVYPDITKWSVMVNAALTKGFMITEFWAMTCGRR